MIYARQQQQKRKRRQQCALSALILLICVVFVGFLLKGHWHSEKQTVVSVKENLVPPEQTAEYSIEHEENTDAQNQDFTPAVSEDEPATAAAYGYYGAWLSDREKDIYAQMVQELGAFQLKLTFYDVPIEVIENAYRAVQADFPEFFWLTGGYTWTEQTVSGISTVWFDVDSMTYDTDVLAAQYAAAKAVVDDIAAQVYGMSDYEKALYVHDLIVQQTTYDYDTYVRLAELTYSDSCTPYGCLVNHLSVCSGYAKAFQWIMEEVGIECLRVTGNDISTYDSHEWNCVLLDGEYYYVDVTWDDPVQLDGSPETLEHTYFCITSDELLETHLIDEGQNEPWCTATEYDYYRMQGTYFEVYNATAVENVIREKAAQGETEYALKFASATECEIAKMDLIDTYKIFDYTGASDAVSFQISKNGRILTITL